MTVELMGENKCDNEKGHIESSCFLLFFFLNSYKYYYDQIIKEFNKMWFDLTGILEK